MFRWQKNKKRFNLIFNRLNLLKVGVAGDSMPSGYPENTDILFCHFCHE
jgi:hypothetical protein